MSGAAKAAAKAAMARLVAEYRINWIYAGTAATPDHAVQPLDPPLYAALAASPTAQMRKAAGYGAHGLQGLAVIADGVPVCAAHFAATAQYERSGTWPLGPDEIALMDIATEERERGKGHAVRLIQAATAHFRGQGYSRLIAFIWWSNTPSLRAFEKAGWRRIGLSIEIRRRAHWRSLRIPIRP